MPKTRITIIGLGRIGGSIGLALKNAKLDLEIVGHDKDLGAAGRAQKRGAVDKTDWNLIGACDGAGLIVLALPLDAIKETFAALKPYVQPGVIVTDTAATKAPVLEWANELPTSVHFIGGHPILKWDRLAGAHGIDHADVNLFQSATWCVTPAVTAEASAIDSVSNFIKLLGATPYFIDAAEHDGLSAGMQHLPALLATALASSATASQGWRELGRMASADFRAATDLMPQQEKLANEQFMAHRTDLVRWVDTLIAELRDLRAILENEDKDALTARVKAAIEKRDQWLNGKLEDTGAAMQFDSVGSSAAHLLLGSLANRTPKRK